MTMRFTIGLGLIALLVVIIAGGSHWLFKRKRALRHGRHRLRRKGRAVRIDDIMVKPDETESSGP